MPRVEVLIDWVGHSKFLTKIDMSRGFWQIPIKEESKKYTAFVVASNQHFVWNVLPFGLSNSSVMLSRLVAKLLKGLGEFPDNYMDDLIICSDTFSDQLFQLKCVFERVREAELTLNPKKCEFGSARLEFLDHFTGSGQVRPLQAKLDALVSFPRPSSRKQLQSYLGLAGYYRKFYLIFLTLRPF